jgi:hypothetical protein
MPKARIKLIGNEYMSTFYFSENKAELARNLENQYIVAATINTKSTGEAAAEEMFDLTNNPSRFAERHEFYGNQRSLSVGDKVEVDGVFGSEEYLCLPEGWVKL